MCAMSSIPTYRIISKRSIRRPAATDVPRFMRPPPWRNCARRGSDWRGSIRPRPAASGLWRIISQRRDAAKRHCSPRWARREAPSCGQCDNCRRGFRMVRQAARWARAAPREARGWLGDFLGHGAAALSRPRSGGGDARDADIDAGPFVAGADVGAPPVEPTHNVDQARRWRRLREARRRIARKTGVAPARLIGDEALARLMERPPADVAELVAICGDQTRLLARFGAALVEGARRSAFFEAGPEI